MVRFIDQGWLIRRHISLPQVLRNDGVSTGTPINEKAASEAYVHSSPSHTNGFHAPNLAAETLAQPEMTLEGTQTSAPPIRYFGRGRRNKDMKKKAPQSLGAMDEELQSTAQAKLPGRRVFSKLTADEHQAGALLKLAAAVLPMRETQVKGQVEEYEGKYIGPNPTRQRHTSDRTARSDGLSR